jgi:glycosyltransferase involved in cell wall biosynthesis
VALEARAAGRPVAASRRGGLAEILREPEDGWLLSPDDRGAWTALFAKLAADPSIARRLHRPRPVRRMRDVCDEMMAVYNELVLARGGPKALPPQVAAESH